MQPASIPSDGGTSRLGVGESLPLFESPNSAVIEQQYPDARQLFFKVSVFQCQTDAVLLGLNCSGLCSLSQNLTKVS